MNYNTITESLSNEGIYDFIINHPIYGDLTFFVGISGNGIELINLGNYDERYLFPVSGQIDSIEAIKRTYRDPFTKRNVLVQTLMIYLNKKGLQNNAFRYDLVNGSYTLGMTPEDIFEVDLVCRGFRQINNLLVLTDKTINVDNTGLEEASPAMTVIKYDLPRTQFKGAYSASVKYNPYDLVTSTVPYYLEDGSSIDKTIWQYTENGTQRGNTLWKDFKYEYTVVFETEELYTSDALVVYDEDKIIVNAAEMGILFYSISHVGELTLESYFIDEVLGKANNLTGFIEKDGDYIYYNRDSYLLKLNINDFNDYTKYDFKEEVNNLLINNGKGKVITKTRMYNITLSLFNSTEILRADANITSNADDLYDIDGTHIEGTSIDDLAYLYIKDNSTYLHVHKDTIERDVYISLGTPKSLSILGDLYYVITSQNILKVYDITKDWIVYTKNHEYYNNIEKNIMYQGTNTEVIDNISKQFIREYKLSLNTDIDTAMIVKDTEDKLKLKNLKNDIIALDDSEYTEKIVYADVNILSTYNKALSRITLYNLSDSSTKYMYGVNYFTFGPELLFLFEKDKLRVIELNPLYPNIECNVMKETDLSLPLKAKTVNCLSLNTNDTLLNSTTEAECTEDIIKIEHLKERTFLFLYDNTAKNVSTFDVYTNSQDFYFEEEHKVQDIETDEQYAYIIDNYEIKIFDLDMNLVHIESLNGLLYPKLYINNHIITAISINNNITYIDISDVHNPIVLETNYPELVKESQCVIQEDRVFLCSNSGVKEYNFDINGFDYIEVNTDTIESTGINNKLQVQTLPNKAVSVAFTNNNLYSISVPNDDILYASSNGKEYIPFNRYIFGPFNILFNEGTDDEMYRVLDDEGFNTGLICTNIIGADIQDSNNTYRTNALSFNSTAKFILTDDVVKMVKDDIEIDIFKDNYSIITSNESYLCASTESHIDIYNLNTEDRYVIYEPNIKYIALDSSSNNLFVHSTQGSYTIDINTHNKVIMNNRNVRDSVYNGDIICIEGPKKEVQAGDGVTAIYGKTLKEIKSESEVITYTIEKYLKNLDIFIDRKQIPKDDFTYDEMNGELNILNHNITGAEVINYLFLTRPFYGTDYIDYVIKYKSEDNTSIPKGYDASGNPVYDFEDLDVIKVPTEIKTVTL